MTDPERQNPRDVPAPEPSPDSAGAPGPDGTPPASAPCEQPPLPGPDAAPGAPLIGSPYPPQPPRPQPYGQALPPHCAQPQQPVAPDGARPAQPQQPFPPYGQNPAAPQAGPQPYGQTPPYAAQQPPVPPYAAGQPPYPPYPPCPGQPYPASPQQPKRKAWPWVLAGCLLVLVLGIGGCASCTAFLALTDGGFGHSRSYGHDGYYDDGASGGYGYDDYDYDYDYGYAGELTIADIEETLSLPAGSVADGKYAAGVYAVGAGEDLKPGLYYVEGSPVDEHDFVVFDAGSSKGSYEVDYGVTYFGNYFVQLEEGQAFAWDADGDLRMYAATDAAPQTEAPYGSGLYRVGTDIPAGTYAVTIQTDAAANAENECGAFVMKDLEFDDDSITDTKYVVRGGSQAVTVKDGDWLELYAATASPAQ